MDGEGKLTREKTRKTNSLQTNESDIHSIDSEHKDADLKELTEGSPAKPEEDLIRVARGDSWRHKSSWTQLISSSSQSSFSISEIVPDLSFQTLEPQAGAPIKDPTRTGVVAKATGRKEISSQRKRKKIIDQFPLLSWIRSYQMVKMVELRGHTTRVLFMAHV
ncbi:unnamed protein product [Lactuca virosa]|uniref:Uncharacterized protein n=1 Tax=Lactuca virosa TaxID=75947 RepID=A0AAU9MMS3_9ASTR|nr:unnamed protein product [Lactuca virosa]